MIEEKSTAGQRRNRKYIKVTEAINNSRSTIILNITIEIFSALVLLTGIIYFFRFMIFFRTRMVDTYFRIFLGAMMIFSAGWFSFIFFKIREHFRLLMKSYKDENKS